MLTFYMNGFLRFSQFSLFNWPKLDMWQDLAVLCAVQRYFSYVKLMECRSLKSEAPFRLVKNLAHSRIRI